MMIMNVSAKSLFLWIAVFPGALLTLGLLLRLNEAESQRPG